MGEVSPSMRRVEPSKTVSDNTHTTRVYTLTVRHGVRLSLVIPMRPILLAFSALVVIAASHADAAPKKKGSTAATKRPSAPVNNSPAPDAALPASGDATASGSSVRGPTRIDFDDRLIQGQTNKSGAVYLYDRKELKIRSMIKKRENFRDEIVGSLYDS